MKKYLVSAFVFVLLLAACTPVQESSVSLDGACLTAYGQEDFTVGQVLKTFEDVPEYKLRDVPALFANPEFSGLLETAEVFSLCAEDSLSFVLYGYAGDYNNVIGQFSQDELVLSYQYNRGTGDIGLCRIVGELDGLLYTCGGGDGPFSSYKLFHMDSEGEVRTIEDCEFSSENSDETVATCSTDLIELY